jgi:hypothetical protein
MPKTGIATLPLHYGKAPKWLFDRMTALSREITYAIVSEFGKKVFLEKLSNPYWFQALGCVLGFDWHSSGLTTTVTGALKEGLRGMNRELGIFIAGGKGATSRKTPEHINMYANKYMINPEPLIYASRMAAKVDNTAVQDGYQLYHHVFVFTYTGEWSVIQQGMNANKKTARRYHWFSEAKKEFVVEPHTAVCCDKRDRTLNLVAFESQPEDFERLLGIKGVGPKTIRALSLISELIYGTPPSYRDPARFSFAHGGKDGTPFPVDKKTYDKTIDVMENAINSAKIGNQAKMDAIRRLVKYFE